MVLNKDALWCICVSCASTPHRRDRTDYLLRPWYSDAPGTRAGLYAPKMRDHPVLRPEPAENTTYGSAAPVGLFFVAPVASARGESRAPMIASQALSICVRTPHPTRYGGGPPKRHSAKEGRAILPTMSLGRLARGVDLLLCYVDLRYGCPFEELAHLSQLTDRREVASVRPI